MEVLCILVSKVSTGSHPMVFHSTFHTRTFRSFYTALLQCTGALFAALKKLKLNFINYIHYKFYNYKFKKNLKN